MKRCLDSTFLSLLVRSDTGALAAMEGWARAGDPVATTEINVLEVAVGVELAQGAERRAQYAVCWLDILSSLEVLPLTRRGSLEAVRRQAALYKVGRPSSLGDLLVAAIAKVGGCDAIVTRDTDDFERVGLLPVEGH